MELKNFLDITIEEIFADRYSRYSKYIIQDRALPDARDGLKPVQRRILYSMIKEGNTFDKQFRKSAKTVGNVIGNYHPHGDTSVYDAMVRTSQDWKVNEKLVIMHGNNGSVDGDSPAAMRYTETKLSKYSELILQDINENTVDMIPNFDDTEMEPTVLPTKVPNLLINGGSGISAGYATDIPPHNAHEVISAAVYYNKNRGATLAKLHSFVKGPDFPTGGVIQGAEEIKKAYETGKGKIVLRAKYKIEKNNIIITEIPYDVNKQVLVAKIDMIRIDKKVDGIVEIIDQSNRDVLEIAINLKKDANVNVILNYLFKYTDLQKNYNFNMIAIDKRRPKLMGLKEMIASFIDHREDVVIKRSKNRLEKAKAKLHIVEGLIRAVDIMEQIILIIRNSKDKADSKSNLIKEYNFSDLQAEAIVMMQLYRLSNTDIVLLEENSDELSEEIKSLTNVLTNNEELVKLIDDELKDVLKLFDNNRKSIIEEEIAKIEIEERDLIKSENNIISISKTGYIKRSTIRSYLASNSESTTMENDYIIRNVNANTRDNMLVFFNDGTFVNLYVHSITESKWKDVGKHISSYAKVNDGVSVVNIIVTNQFKDLSSIICMTKGGYFINVNIEEFNVKLNNKVQYQKLKANDEVVSVCEVKKDGLGLLNNNKFLTITSLDRYVLLDVNNIELGSIKRVGLKIMTFRKNEEIACSSVYNNSFIVLTNKGGYIRITNNNIEITDKPRLLFENMKSNVNSVIKVMCDYEKDLLFISGTNQDIVSVKDMQKCEVGNKLKSLSRYKDVQNVENIIEIT